MIDIHSHILPAIDDGPQTLAEALAMCRMAAADGITTMVATPHYVPGVRCWNANTLLSGVSLLRDALHAEGTEITILSGAELPVYPELAADVSGLGSCLTLNNTTSFLVEFNPFSVPVNIEKYLTSLLDRGLTPIIAHPERCGWFVGQTALLGRLVNQGVLLQLTAGSILGQFSSQIQDFSLRLIRQGLAHVIASDAHDCIHRPPQLSEAVRQVADLIGRERADAMVNSTPRAIINGLPVQTQMTEAHYRPLPIRSRSWLRRLFDAAA